MIFLLYNPPVRELQIKYTTREKLARLDWTGYFFLVTGLVLFSYSLTSSISIYPWKSPHIIVPLLVGVALLSAFFIYEYRFTDTGVLHHGLFSRGRNFALALLCIFVEGLVFFASNQYFGFEIVAIYQQNQFKAGLYYTTAWFTVMISTTVAGIYCSRSKSIRLPVMVAFTSFALYNALMATLNLSTRSNTLGYAVFLGIGLGIALNALVVVAQLSTPPELISTTTGLMIATRSFRWHRGTVNLHRNLQQYSHPKSAKQSSRRSPPSGSQADIPPPANRRSHQWQLNTTESDSRHFPEHNTKVCCGDQAVVPAWLPVYLDYSWSFRRFDSPLCWVP